MQEQFDGFKDKLGGEEMAGFQDKLTAMKDSLAGLSEMSGTEMLTALGDIKTQGVELAAELMTLKNSVMGGGEEAAQ